MGKKNPAQRTKGNAKPSSSGRAAELLSSSSAPAYTFGLNLGASCSQPFDAAGAADGDGQAAAFPTAAAVAFPASTAGPAFIPGAEDLDSGGGQLDGDFRLLLKKMTKKDTTTKCKALNELVALLKAKEAADVKALMPYWPRMYNSLSTDSDRRVRELTQQALAQLVAPDRKKLLAPHLKSFLGAWMLAQVDPHAPAASLALQAFNTAFARDKQIEAIKFCRNEIFRYLKDILLDQSPSTLSDPKTTPKDEMEAKYERVFASSLSALNLLVQTLGCADDQPLESKKGSDSVSETKMSESETKQQEKLELETLIIDLLSNKKMLKLSVHGNPMVRGSWFSLVATVCEKHPDLVTSSLAPTFSASILNRFEETDPLAIAAFWNAVMHVLTVVEDCWSHVSIRKSVLPKLWSLLRSGCAGSSTLVCPSIVVLVSHLPRDLITCSDGAAMGFFKEMSSCVFEALEKGCKTFQSPSEAAALVLALMESLQFLMFHDEEMSESTMETRRSLMKVMLHILKVGFQHKHVNQIISPHFINVMQNVVSKVTESSGESQEEWESVKETFWSGYSRLLDDFLEKENDDKVLKKFSDLLKNCSKGAKPAVKKKVGFATEDLASGAHPVTAGPDPVTAEADPVTAVADLVTAGPDPVTAEADPTPKPVPTTPVLEQQTPTPSKPNFNLSRLLLEELILRTFSKLQSNFSESLLKLFCDTSNNHLDAGLIDRVNSVVITDRTDIPKDSIWTFFELVWKPLQLKAAETSVESQEGLATLLKTLVLSEKDASRAMLFLESFINTLEDTNFFKVMIKASLESGPDDLLSGWVQRQCVTDQLIKITKLIFDKSPEDCQREQCFLLISDALQSTALQSECLSRLTEILQEVAEATEASDVFPSNMQQIARLSSLAFTHHPQILQQDVGKSLFLHLLKVFIEFEEICCDGGGLKSKDIAGMMRSLKESWVAGMSVQTLPTSLLRDIAKMLHPRIFYCKPSVKENLVSVIYDICSLISDSTQKPNLDLLSFLNLLFLQDLPDCIHSVCSQLWFSRSMVENSLFISNSLNASMASPNHPLFNNSPTNVRNYLQYLSFFADVILKLGFTLDDLPSTADSVSEAVSLLSFVSQLCFAVKLLDASPSVFPQIVQIESLENPDADNVYVAFGKVKSVLLEFVDRFLLSLPNMEDSLDRRDGAFRVWEPICELVALLVERAKDAGDGTDAVLHHYRRTCILQLLSLLNSASNNELESLLGAKDPKRCFCGLLDTRLKLVSYKSFKNLDANFTTDVILAFEATKQTDAQLVMHNELEFSVEASVNILTRRNDVLTGKRIDPDLGSLKSRLELTEISSEEHELKSLLYYLNQLLSTNTRRPHTTGLTVTPSFLRLLDALVVSRDSLDDAFLDCVDVDGVDWEVVHFNVNVMQLLRNMLSPTLPLSEHSYETVTRLTLKNWDFIFCTLLSWLQCLRETIRSKPDTQALISSLKFMAFAKGCCDLVAAISHLFCTSCCPFNFEPDPEDENDDAWLKASPFAKVYATSILPWTNDPKRKPSSDWNRCFRNEAFATILSTFITFSESVNDFLTSKDAHSTTFFTLAKSTWTSIVARSFRSALECCLPIEEVLQSEDLNIPPKLMVEDAGSQLPRHLQSLLNYLTTFLCCPLVDLQLSSYFLLLRMLPSVAEIDEAHWSADCADREAREAAGEPVARDDNGWSPPSALVTLLESSQTALNLLVQHLSMEEALRLSLDDSTYAYVLSYALSWNLLRRLINAASSELRAQYAIFLRSHVSVFLRQFLHLLPDCLFGAAGTSPHSGHVARVASLAMGTIFQTVAKESHSFVLFNQDPILAPRKHTVPSLKAPFHLTSAGTAFYLQHAVQCPSWRTNIHDVILTASASPDAVRSLHGLAGATYIGTFRDLPALVRQWWTDSDKKTSSLVERISSNHISPVLCARELNSVARQSSRSKLENITIKVRKQSREVIALYNMDEITMELLIKLPANYPLGQVLVECGKRVGEVKEQKRWMLQLTTFLQYQNGSIVDGVGLWKKNIDKPFEGVEPCMICFSVLHGSNYQLPKLICKACKKKFHSVCLYKWFSTSNNSSCPLCRSLF